MASQFIFALPRKKSTPLSIGPKALRLAFLAAHNFRVPETYICTVDAHQAWQQNPQATLAQIRQEITERLPVGKPYAVRSAANIEDGNMYSFAGQFASQLGVQGVDPLLQAVEAVWASAENPTVKSYLQQSSLANGRIQMSVILQAMVEPVVSGVAFSKNPVTGLDDVIVEAVEGSGVALLQEGVTPHRWAYRWGGWIDEPEEEPIDRQLIHEVVTQTKLIAAKYGRPVDLEWVYDGTAVYWVQLREITSLNHLNIYSNRISREMLPGIIKPLIWSINIPLISGAWIDIFTELIGPNDIQPTDLTKAFYYRTYFNMGTIGRIFKAVGMQEETLEIMLGVEGGDERPQFRPSTKIIRHIPRMTRFTFNKLRFSREIDALLPQMDLTFAQFARQQPPSLSESQLLQEIDRLYAFTQRAAYANIIGPLLMQMYNAMFKSRLERSGIQFEQFDLLSKMAELHQYNPNPWLDDLSQQFNRLEAQQQAAIRQGSYADFIAMGGVEELQTAVAQFITQFGHLSDSGNDFSCVPWREDPDFVLRMIVNRQQVAHDSVMNRYLDDQGDGAVYTWDDAPLSRAQRWRLRWLYQRARQYRLYREAISFKYTYGYGLFRNFILALADRLVARGLLAARDDIFYLYIDEIRALVDGTSDVDASQCIQARKQEIASVAEVILPEIIYGNDQPPLENNQQARKSLAGIPTSGGYYQGPVCVIRSVAEFDKMVAGSVLVIPYSDVSWTPLFARAGAVVAESGGILSHSSIVAREYRLPAVVSVTDACRLLPDGAEVTVDGFKGKVTILNGGET
ncbi:MAG: hypothetical protein KC441_03275 [Anaerolineales bacterium]|nr:hypothetical protein [Anaerolineales bacterium]